MLAPNDPNDDDDIDLEALRRAMDIAMRDPPRAAQLTSQLGDQPWIEVAQFAASCCQRKALELKPWQSPPCDGRDDDKKASRMLDRMLDADISQWEPDPLTALAKMRVRSESEHR
jgi:hypothetical protein